LQLLKQEKIMENGTGTNAPAQTVKLELTLDDVNVVLAGLGELPAKTSLAVIDKVRGQAISQLQTAAADAQVQSEAVN
jgi:hypothetical protein